MEARPRVVKFYEAEPGYCPAWTWLENLPDERAQDRLWVRLRRLERGNLGAWRSVGGGVIELKVDVGLGYRLYAGQDGLALVLILWGGTKARQSKDIQMAQGLWARYLAAKEGRRHA